MSQSIVVAVDESGADPERLEELSLQLRDELLDTDAEDVTRLVDGEAPAGTRALDVAAVGALVVTVASTVGSVASVVEVVRRWLTRAGGDGRTVEMTIGEHHLKLVGGPREEQARLIEAFLRAAGQPPV
jgi:hypothetical protein